MKVAVCLLVGMDAQTRTPVELAAQLVFPRATLMDFNTLEEASNHEPASGGELLVFANPDKESAGMAAETTDASGLRRWAIVLLGSPTAIEGVEIVPSEEWGERVLARAFRSAVVQHQLIRENLRLRGDLRTWAFRISHDLRTPLGGILSAGEALEEMLVEQDSSSVGLAKSLCHSADDLGRLIDRVSMLTKASLSVVSKKPVAMGEIVWAVLQRQQRQILKNQAVITQPDVWPEVEAVSPWIEAVWGNLIVNALQHGREPFRIELGWSQEHDRYRFWVADNGGGIPPEKRDILFQSFHLLHHTNARNGVGLSVVQRLVELQNGRCGYEPRPEGGSCFFFTLPFSVSGPVSVPKAS